MGVRESLERQLLDMPSIMHCLPCCLDTVGRLTTLTEIQREKRGLQDNGLVLVLLNPQDIADACTLTPHYTVSACQLTPFNTDKCQLPSNSVASAPSSQSCNPSRANLNAGGPGAWTTYDWWNGTTATSVWPATSMHRHPLPRSITASKLTGSTVFMSIEQRELCLGQPRQWTYCQ